MTEQSPSPIGNVAQEAARLIEDMATMARLSYSRESDPSGYVGGPAREDAPTDVPGATNERSESACSQCGATGGEALGDGTTTCRLCPLCRGIGLLRSVRPETVDLLADLAMSVAAGLREVALWSRASGPAAAAKAAPPASPPAYSAESDRAPVQDIPVDDEGEG